MKIKLLFYCFLISVLSACTDSDAPTNRSVRYSISGSIIKSVDEHDNMLYYYVLGDSLNSVTLVEQIDRSPLWGEIVVPDRITVAGKTYYVNHIAISAFEDQEWITHLKLPSNISYIAPNTFRNCGLLSHIDLPSQITYLGESAFYGCSRLKEINFSPALEVIEPRAFQYCWALEDLVLPEGLKKIGVESFMGCSNLAKIDLSCLDSIPNESFMFCRNLREVKMSSKMKFLAASAFAGCDNLREITIPESVTYIGSYCFYYVNNLTVRFESSTPPIIKGGAFEKSSTIIVPLGALDSYKKVFGSEYTIVEEQ